MEVRLHGRGGQGAVLASKILAKALVEDGKSVTAIPSFGFERRGAPVACFLRFEDEAIRSMTNIYHPDIIMCIDPTVGRAVDIFAGMPEGGTLVQAGSKPLDEWGFPDHLKTIGLCDAFSIAMEIFRRPITNTIMLGAFAKTTGLVSLDGIAMGLKSANFRDAGLEQNLKAVQRGYDETTVHRREGRDAA